MKLAAHIDFVLAQVRATAPTAAIARIKVALAPIEADRLRRAELARLADSAPVPKFNDPFPRSRVCPQCQKEFERDTRNHGRAN